jgi:SAM-dependent methyltransferase
MAQRKVWDNEYKDNKLVTMSEQPQKDFLNFLKYLKKEQKIIVSGLNILDLGCGLGKNSIYLAKLDNTVTGTDISNEAIRIANERASKARQTINFQVSNIGSKYSFKDESFDLVIDVMTSNSLNETERDIYLSETKRVMKADSFFFVRALRKEGDKNAKNLLKQSPGPEKNTYKLKDLGLVERVFEEKEIREIYGKYFDILKLENKTAYTKYANQSFKRNYWLVYMQKK